MPVPMFPHDYVPDADGEYLDRMPAPGDDAVTVAVKRSKFALQQPLRREPNRVARGHFKFKIGGGSARESNPPDDAKAPSQRC